MFDAAQAVSNPESATPNSKLASVGSGRPLDRLLTDQTSAQIEAGMAAASAEGFPRIAYRRRQFHATALVAAAMSHLFDEFSHDVLMG
jgi:hypothetical protein